MSPLAVAFGTAVVILLPFGMTLLPTGDPTTSIFDKFLSATETYKWASTINALNFWRTRLLGSGTSSSGGATRRSLSPSGI